MSPKHAPPRRGEGLSPHGISLPLHGISSHLAVQSKGYAWGCQGKTPILLVDPDQEERRGVVPEIPAGYCILEISSASPMTSPPASTPRSGGGRLEGRRGGGPHLPSSGIPQHDLGHHERRRRAHANLEFDAHEGDARGIRGGGTVAVEVGEDEPAHALDNGLRPRPGVSAQGSLAGTKEISDALPGRADHAIAVEIVLEDDAGRLRHQERRDPG